MVTALFKAALAKILVESRVGKDESFCVINRGSSVQASTTASQPWLFNFLIIPQRYVRELE